MKKTCLFIVSILLAGVALAQDNTDKQSEQKKDGPFITFVENAHDFGDIYEGDKVEYTFNFENTGNRPLIISNVLTSCGCTVTDWPKDPVKSGKKSSITATFNSRGKQGKQTKVITIQSNAINGQEKVRIIAHILPKKEKQETKSQDSEPAKEVQANDTK